jgi:hypothetical protein
MPFQNQVGLISIKLIGANLSVRIISPSVVQEARITSCQHSEAPPSALPDLSEWISEARESEVPLICPKACHRAEAALAPQRSGASSL